MPLLALPFPAIDPVALAIGPITIKWYALAYIAGLIGGWYYARRLVMADRLWGVVKRPQVVDIDDLVVWVALGVVLGGRIGYVLFYNLPMYLADPIEILAIRNGGMSFHGGFLGAILAFLLFARAKKLNGYTLLDIGAVVVPIGLFFGRIANFINGELWGRPTDVPWAMVFPSGGPVPRHPSQLYEAVCEGLLLFLLLLLAEHRGARRRPGIVTGLFLVGYAVARMSGELFRQPDAQLGFLVLGTTMGQLLSIPVLIAGILLIWWARRQPASTAAPQHRAAAR
jgi:phosphatidylglycerol:prolipoprotein diacylglycerol transferase